MTRPVIVWFRSDLRIQDNTALATAARQGPVIAVFLRSLLHWQRHGHGANKLDFWGRGVAALRDSLDGLGIPLLHRDIDDFGEAPAAVGPASAPCSSGSTARGSARTCSCTSPTQTASSHPASRPTPWSGW